MNSGPSLSLGREVWYTSRFCRINTDEDIRVGTAMEVRGIKGGEMENEQAPCSINALLYSNDKMQVVAISTALKCPLISRPIFNCCAWWVCCTVVGGVAIE